MKEVLTLKSFTYLYLAKMAEKTQIIQLKPENKNIVVLGNIIDCGVTCRQGCRPIPQ